MIKGSTHQKWITLNLHVFNNEVSNYKWEYQQNYRDK